MCLGSTILMQWRARGIGQAAVEQRHDPADARDAEPDRQIFGPVRHQQADRVAFGDALRKRPSGVAVRSPGQCPIGQTFLALGEEQRRSVAVESPRAPSITVRQECGSGGRRSAPSPPAAAAARLIDELPPRRPGAVLSTADPFIAKAPDHDGWRLAGVATCCSGNSRGFHADSVQYLVARLMRFPSPIEARSCIMINVIALDFGRIR